MKLEFISYGYRSNQTIAETLEAFRGGWVGCVYPQDEQSYYICSNVPVPLSEVYCTDGSFFGERTICEALCEEEDNEK